MAKREGEREAKDGKMKKPIHLEDFWKRCENSQNGAVKSTPRELRLR